MTDFHILHVTDLHCHTDEDQHAKDRREGWLSEIQRYASEISGFNLVVCSGDLGHRGETQNLLSGFKYLQRIIAAASTSKKLPVIITPGNHDVTWPSLDSTRAWTNKKRYGDFIRACKILKSRAQVFRPPLIFTHSGSLAHRTYKRWYYWNRKHNVFVLPLSTVDASGTVLLGSQEYRTIATEILTKLADPRLVKKIQRLITADVAFVNTPQIKQFMAIADKWRTTNSPESDLFRRAVKIAVVHHPLFPVLGEMETELRAFDTTLNGMAVVKILSSYGFHVLLYGHKHRMGLCVNHGSWIDYTSQSGHIFELVTSAAGNLSTGTGNSTEIGIQAIKISGCSNPNDDTQPRSIHLTRRLLDSVDGEREKSYCLMEITPTGEARWIHTHDDGPQPRAYIRREDGISRQFAKAAKSVEQQFLRKGRYQEATEYLGWKILELEEYAKGNRGVGDSFVKQMREAARSAQTIIFVDHSGDETWLQPDLMEHLALLLRIFAERNGALMGQYDSYATPSNGNQRNWRHRSPIETLWQQIRDGPRTPCDSVATYRGALPSQDAEPLAFDMMRVLLWSEESLKRPAARMLKRLHCVFDVPLIWVDVHKIGDLDITPRDFHLVWNKNGPTESPMSFHPEQSENHMPDGGMWLDENGERQVMRPEMIKQRWFELCQLLTEKYDGPGTARDVLAIEN